MIINTTLSSSTYLFVPAIAAGLFICACHLIHHQLHLLLHFLLSTSPQMCCTSSMSFGMIATHFPWIAHSLVSQGRQIRYASEASWMARRATLCIQESDLKIWKIMRARCWKGAFLIKCSVLFWYLWILQRAGSQGYNYGASSHHHSFGLPLTQPFPQLTCVWFA